MKLKKLFRFGWLLVPMFLTLVLGFWLGIHGQSSWQDIVDTELTDKVIQSDAQKVNFDWKGNGLVTFWLDDGWLSEYEQGVLYLQSKGLRGALAITTDYLIGYDAYMNWAQVKNAAHMGWEISSHSRTHDCNPAEMNSEILYNEVVGSKMSLAGHGIYVWDYVAPCGKYTPELRALTSKYYRALRVTDFGTNTIPLDDTSFLHAKTVALSTSQDDIQAWIEDASKKKAWLILVFHQIDYSNEEYSVSPEQFKYIVDKILDSELTVVTPNQVFGLSEEEN